MILIGIGLAIGLAAIIGATHFMASLLCGITANDPWTLAVTAAILALLAIVAGFCPPSELRVSIRWTLFAKSRRQHELPNVRARSIEAVRSLTVAVQCRQPSVFIKLWRPAGPWAVG